MIGDSVNFTIKLSTCKMVMGKLKLLEVAPLFKVRMFWLKFWMNMKKKFSSQIVANMYFLKVLLILQCPATL